MREIKFRAWDKKKKEMIGHNKLFRLDTSNEYPFLPLLENMYANSIRPLDVVIMQYTGLKDKNGVEIYEGDVLRDSLGCVYVVKWEQNTGRFLGFTIENERKIVYVGREPKSEVIGNIYENPELLEEVK